MIGKERASGRDVGREGEKWGEGESRREERKRKKTELGTK